MESEKMTILKKRHAFAASIKSSLSYMLVATLAIGALDYLYVRFAPTRFFFEYASITNTSANIGEYASFISTSRVSTLRPLKSQEEIVCVLDEGGLVQFGEREVSYTPSIKTEVFITSPEWTLTSAVIPDIEGYCHLEANVSMSLRYGIKKYQFITHPESNEFRVTRQ